MSSFPLFPIKLFKDNSMFEAFTFTAAATLAAVAISTIGFSAAAVFVGALTVISLVPTS
jgi:hypothetical protein